MSDKAKSAIGLFLILLSIISLFAAFLPIRPSDEYLFPGRGMPISTIPSFPELSPSDSFNTGDRKEISQYPGIGNAIASLVIEEREKNGLFFYPEDLLSVKGIGEKKLEQIRPGLLMEE